MDGVVVEGFVPDLGGRDDPLEALARMVGSQDDFDAPQDPRVVQNRDVEMDASAEEERLAPTTNPAPVSLMSAIEEHYKLLCTTKRIEALKSHLELLKNIPVPLIKQVDIKTAPLGVVGGAVIDVAAATGDENEENNPPSPEHVAALLETLTKSSTEGKLLLLDHLELSGLPLPSTTLSAFVHQAAALGPWWRLRSLALSGCNIDISHLQQLIAPEAQSFLWHLERLDLSYNPCLGRDVANGTLRPLTAFTAPSTLMMMRLWRGAPLKYLDLSYCELSSSVLAVCLRTLRSYPLPSSTGGCGTPLHDGTRPSIQCLKLGPPGDGVWTDGLLAEIAAVIEASPQLTAVELCGAGTKERDALTTTWQAVHEKRGINTIQAAEVRPGIVRFAAGRATQQLLSIEHPPTKHSLPGPETPTPEDNSNRNTNALGDLPPQLLDDWNNVYGTDCGSEQPRRMVQDVLRPSVPPRGSLLPPRRPEGNGGGGGGSTRPRGGGGNGGGDGAPRRQRGANGGGNGGGGSNVNRRDRLPAHHTTAADYAGYCNDEDKPVRQPRNASGANPRKKRASGPRAERMYRGGNAEDELPAGGIDINSDDDGRPMDYSDEDSYYSDEEEDDLMDVDTTNGPGGRYYDEEEEDEEDDQQQQQRGGRQGEGLHRSRQSGLANNNNNHLGGNTNTNAAVPTLEQTIEQRFKIRDGEMDVDSKLGRIYRADARSFFKSIPDKADQKAAKAAFNLWDSCAENAWDRHRWDRPSKTQNDEPHVLGQLNKLFDLAKKYKHDLGFPFPKWVPGGGTEAFTKPLAAPPPPPPSLAVVVQKVATTTSSIPVSAVSAPPKPKVNKPNKSLPPRNRMVDDGGRGKESDREESDGGDDFMVPDGPVSDSSSFEEDQEDDQEEDQEEVEVIDLVGSGKKIENPFMLPESQSPVRQTTAHNNRALIDSDSDDEDLGPSGAANNNNTTTTGSGGGRGKEFSAAAREIARLSAWNWDSRKEEHPPNEAVYGLADGKRSRRQRFTASQIVGALDGSEEQQQHERKPRRRSVAPEEEEERQPVVYDESSSSDDDVPLAAQFSRYRTITTPGSNEKEVGVFAVVQKKKETTPPPSEGGMLQSNGIPVPEIDVAVADVAAVDRDAITPAATEAVDTEAVDVAAPPLPTDPSSADRAAALARALLGTLYNPKDSVDAHQMPIPSLPVETREEDKEVAAVAAAPPSRPVSSVARIGVVPDSQEDEDFNIL